MWKQTVGCVVSLLLGVLPLHAQEVIATGSAAIYNGNVGSAKNQALQNAQRQAVEQGVGALIDSQTLSNNFQIIKDEIFSSSRGFVTSYQILEEGSTADNAFYEVKIRAKVSDKGIRDQLTALRILHKKMGNKRLMVVYHKQDPKASKRSFQTVPTLMGTLRDAFNNAGFRVFNDGVMQNVYSAIEVGGVIDRPAESLIALEIGRAHV